MLRGTHNVAPPPMLTHVQPRNNILLTLSGPGIPATEQPSVERSMA